MSTSVSSSTRCTLAAQSAKRRPSAVSRSIGSYGLRGGPNSSTNRDEYDRRGGRVVLEVLEDEREAAVRRAANHLADLLGHRRPPVGGKPHDLVLVLVDREAEIRGERRIQHAERVREPDLAQQRDVGRAAVGRRSPWPTVSVAHSPTPSAVRMAARRVGAVRKAAAAWDCVVLGEQDLLRAARRDAPR